ncbi:MAG: hemolysin-type calcium-binding protein [Limimaricola sp.]|uniref:Hint domain-containing protein n=1 Tax=Limimaricola sp. TaxID=2211665 RepID=UPI001E1252C6|nr:Hint domain-containing protein [Limimaricola sp.]MBI1417775.1 hemolysin-type calcium-binding protein [Limimaricola sp.]
MGTAFRGTFVISWSQTELDGLRAAPLDCLRTGASWGWTGEAVRVDGPSGVLPLGDAMGMADIRARAALSVRRLRGDVDVAPPPAAPDLAVADLFDQSFDVTDGEGLYTITLVPLGAGRRPLLMFTGLIPPRETELWVIRARIASELRAQCIPRAGGVICFTPGTMLLTADGPRDVASLCEGDHVQTKDNGCVEILWLGRRHVSGARLMVMPHLYPVRLRAGALDAGVPDAGLLVSPDHRMVLRGPRARALFNTDEVLVTARDLIDDQAVQIDRSCREVTYVHLLLPQHEVVFANGVETESFHPASAEMGGMGADDRDRLLSRLPEIARDPSAYGAFARRPLSISEAAILRHDAGW